MRIDIRNRVLPVFDVKHQRSRSVCCTAPRVRERSASMSVRKKDDEHLWDELLATPFCRYGAGVITTVTRYQACDRLTGGNSLPTASCTVLFKVFFLSCDNSIC